METTAFVARTFPHVLLCNPGGDELAGVRTCWISDNQIFLPSYVLCLMSRVYLLCYLCAKVLEETGFYWNCNAAAMRQSQWILTSLQVRHWPVRPCKAVFGRLIPSSRRHTSARFPVAKQYKSTPTIFQNLRRRNGKDASQISKHEILDHMGL